MKVLVLCTGNSCRSQMGEAFLKSFDNNNHVFSAGTSPSTNVHPLAIQVMKEVGIDMSTNSPKSVDTYLDNSFDYVITVCDGAKESCPVFSGSVKHSIHIGFDDPAEIKGSDDFILNEFRRIRDEIYNKFKIFYNKNLKH